MKVAHFSTFVDGGAGVAARRLHDALRNQGVDSRFHHLHGQSPDPSYRLLRYTPDGWSWRLTRERWRARRYAEHERAVLSGRPDGLELFSFPRGASQVTARWTGEPVDVLHLHWVAGLFDWPTFFRSVPDSMPVVWTQHDMNAFTGGCHYAWHCRNFETGCGECFQLARPAPNDASRANARVKRSALAGKNLHVVANSRWTEREARASSILAEVRSFRTIHYGLDHAVFAPRDRASCRAALGLGADSAVVAFGAVDVGNRRKGLDQLVGALERVRHDRLELLVFGAGAPPRGLARTRVRHVGPVASEAALAEIYAAADLFVMPSLHEAFGQTALEALACGVPVVAFGTGGIPDMVFPGVTGLLADAGDCGQLAACIEALLSDPDRRRAMGAAGRELVLREFTLARQAGRYLELYRSLLGTRAAQPGGDATRPP